MASYDPYDRDYSRRYVREERRDDRDPRFLDSRDYARPYPSRDLVPRAREDSDLSVEEIRRDFPPPTGRDIRRARSAEPQYDEYEYDYHRRGHDSRHDRDRDYDRYSDRHSRRGGGSVYYEEEERKPKHKSMSKQEKIIAAVAGAALLAGGKEIYDRHEAKTDGTDVQRNALSSVALAGFGALAGYQGAEFYSKHQAKKDQKATYILHRGRDGQITEYYSDEEDGSKEKKGHKNFLESAIAATGLGAAVKTLTGGGDDKRSDTRSRRGSPAGSRAGSRSRSRGPGANKIQKAAMASLLAGATEAFRVAKEPGGWKGEKTKRILTAAAGAATVDAAQSDSHGKLGLAESVIGGLVGNRLINGSKKDIEEDKLTGRSRSRSRARSQSGGGGGTGLAALATAGLGALGAKKVLDHSRSRSRGRDYDSRSPSPDRHRQRSRSRSVVDKARNSLAKLGIGGGAVAAADDHRRRDQDDFDDRGSSRRSRRYSDDMYDDDRGYGRSRGGDYESERSHRSGRRDSSRRRGGSRSGYGSESDLGDSDEDEKRHKKMRGKQILTTGLATVATIHAAHGVYQSMEKRRARQKAVKEGRLSPAEAKKLKTKAIMQDAASVGIAALGIKGAIGEMKEAKEMTDECKEFKEEKARRHERREIRRQQGRSLRDGHDRRADSLPAGPRSRYGGYESDEYDDYGPRYYDDNPYGTGRLPAPPMGYRP
ncbi:HLH transcription factor (GlcD gamma) [Purpureocillium lavendulum]|uniref:HLH transcription factor (GlcD gamma) n=1 Tax=Purpureocillium lavendulum TaxID=1247861 RepID=A0AB34G2X2_9HYPO|nr:HLH transcription factor (GlcD gamma) [Purpureocillium lavendulum]